MPTGSFKAAACLRTQGQQHGWGPKEQKDLGQQKKMETCHAVLESELLQLLRRSRLQLEQVQHKSDTDTACAVFSSTSNNSGRSKRANLLSCECTARSAVSLASLLQNVHTLSLLQQELQQQLKRQQQQQPEASAPAAAATAIAALVQEVQRLCNSNNNRSSSIRGPLPFQLPKKRVYWQQLQQNQQQQLLLKLVDQALADLELWAEEVPSDCEAAASPVPVQPAATELQHGRQQQAFAVERRQILPLENGGDRELLLQHSRNPIGVGASAAAAPTAAPAAAALPDSQLEKHLLDTASEMKQGALMFRERLQKDNILLQRTAARQEALQQQQQRGLDAAKKLLRFTFFFALMPLVQLAIALAVTLAMISFILVTPG
ncbi:hypothetical protein, conserved [Eimeria brunetti]|uniref:Uncharacterized protein n=1 Tax=Eimeria brunetti TaxID=51314 RepID=U6LS82_9EIME|nr:hypothetical protein, conserved [Eimeria brunetti]